MYICKLKKYVHQVSNHRVFRRWFTETDVKHFKSGTKRNSQIKQLKKTEKSNSFAGLFQRFCS